MNYHCPKCYGTELSGLVTVYCVNPNNIQINLSRSDWTLEVIECEDCGYSGPADDFRSTHNKTKN